MAKELSRSERPDFFAKGGTTKMFDKGHAGRAVPDYSGKQNQSGGGGGEDKFASGGSEHMFGKGHAGKKVPGISGKASQEG